MAFIDNTLDRYYTRKVTALVVSHLESSYTPYVFYAIYNRPLHTVSIYCNDTEVYEFSYSRALILLVSFLSRGWEPLDNAVAQRLSRTSTLPPQEEA